MKERTFSNMKEALKGLEEAGYTASFIFENNQLRVAESDQTFKAGELKIVETFRFEGESNPDDMSIIYVIESKGGCKGTLTDAFGVYGTSEISEFMDRVSDSRSEEERPNILPSDSVC